jgi:hypothetical protein
MVGQANPAGRSSIGLFYFAHYPLYNGPKVYWHIEQGKNLIANKPFVLPFKGFIVPRCWIELWAAFCLIHFLFH